MQTIKQYIHICQLWDVWPNFCDKLSVLTLHVHSRCKIMKWAEQHGALHPADCRKLYLTYANYVQYYLRTTVCTIYCHNYSMQTIVKGSVHGMYPLLFYMYIITHFFFQKMVLVGVAAIEDKLQEVSVEGGLESGSFTVYSNHTPCPTPFHPFSTSFCLFVPPLTSLYPCCRECLRLLRHFAEPT